MLEKQPLVWRSSYNVTKKNVAKTMSPVFQLTHSILLLGFYSQRRSLADIFFREISYVSSNVWSNV